MTITNTSTGTAIDEIAPRIYRIHTPTETVPGGFSFNQYLLDGDEPLLFHTGLRRLFPAVREAVEHVMPVNRLRYIGLSHFEADECGSMNEWLAVAPAAVPLCSRIAALVSINDVADRPARAMADGETLDLGGHVVKWLDTPHLPHAWETGYLMETTTGTLLCGDLFTQGGLGSEPLTGDDILELSEGFRQPMDYFSHASNTSALIDKLAAETPTTLACMHGSAWQGDGAAMLRSLAQRI